MKKKRIRALSALSLRLGAGILAVWLACMLFFTVSTAQYIFRELVDAGFDLAHTAGRFGRLDLLYPDDATATARRDIPGLATYHMLEALSFSGLSITPPNSIGYPAIPDSFTAYDSQTVHCQTASLFLSPTGEELLQSSDVVYFPYVEQAVWQRGEEDGPTTAYAWIDLGDESDERYQIFRTIYAGTQSLWNIEAMRITGYFDGDRIEPLALALLDDSAVHRAVEQTDPSSQIIDYRDGSEEVSYEYTLCSLDAQGLLAWDIRFDDTADAPPEREIVTIYALHPQMTLYETGGAVRFREETHSDLLALLRTQGYYYDKGSALFTNSASQFNLWNLIVFSSWSYYDTADYDPASGQPPETVMTILSALQANPLLIAMSFLKKAYLWTFLLALALFFALRASFRRNLIRPICEVERGLAEGAYLHDLREHPPQWAEAYALSQRYEENRDKLRINKNEITRLTTALDYAETAEKTRRQMTSNIAHELKTPLAVIHSYAEGLKEHIAEDKREHYLDTILAESERMDEMVLEMLDLSRLEAGKVKLSRDDFSLSALTESVFCTLSLAAQAKKLRITLDLPENCMVTADEARIRQVIENFATNAIKYTPPEGTITVQLRCERSKTTFSIENDCQPLSREALQNVWNVFYRTDEARTSGGTGLGLAIAKNIIELHGGTCSVQNTKTGVRFLFTIG